MQCQWFWIWFQLLFSFCSFLIPLYYIGLCRDPPDPTPTLKKRCSILRLRAIFAQSVNGRGMPNPKKMYWPVGPVCFGSFSAAVPISDDECDLAQFSSGNVGGELMCSVGLGGGLSTYLSGLYVYEPPPRDSDGFIANVDIAVCCSWKNSINLITTSKQHKLRWTLLDYNFF